MSAERISDERFREWEQALAPYENDVEEFAKQKGLEVRKWYHDTPAWHIGKIQLPHDLNKIWWSIQLIYDEDGVLGYDENGRRVSLTVGAWVDKEYDVPEGRVHERRLSNYPGPGKGRGLVALWKKNEQIKIGELLQIAYERANSFTLQDLNMVSASIKGVDGITKIYNPRPQK